MNEFFVIANYKHAQDEQSFERGLVDITIYQHETLLLVCEIRKYRDGLECLSHGFVDGDRVFGKSLATAEIVEESSINIIEKLLMEAANKMSKFYNKGW